MHTHTLSYSSVCLSIIDMHTYRHTNAMRHIQAIIQCIQKRQSATLISLLITSPHSPLTPPITTTLHRNSGSVIQGGYILTVYTL